MTDWLATIHPLDAAIALEPEADRRVRGLTVAVCDNKVGPFGGATAAAFLACHRDAARPVR